MSEEHAPQSTPQQPEKDRATPEPTLVGASPVGPIGIVLIMVYVILFCIFLLYSLVQLWPLPTTAGGAAPPTSPITFFLWTVSLSDEVRLFLIVALAGALGGLVHTLRSFYWYTGNRELVQSWLVMLILLPFVGTTLGLIFYFVIRGGFFTPGATAQQTSPFGFAAVAGLIGMFAEEAVLKLKQVAETLLAKVEPGKDAKPQEPMNVPEGKDAKPHQTP